MRGLFVVLAVSVLAFAAGAILANLARQLPYGWVIEGLTLLMLLRHRDCTGRMQRSWRLLVAQNYSGGQEAVDPLVRYSVKPLDDFGIARAAIKGGMERFSERFLATIFWYLLLGLPGVLAFRSINAVADVIGNGSPRHASFGFVAARLDDILNLAPVIIVGSIISIAAIFVPRTSPINAFKGWFGDFKERGLRSNYRAEGAMAGALGIAVGGPQPFENETIAGAWIGDGRARAMVSDIQRAVYLIWIACLLSALGLALVIIV